MTKPFDREELAARIKVGERLLALETRDLAIFGMAKLAESRDPETGQHLERVRLFCREISGELQRHPAFAGTVGASFLRSIFVTSPLHDIGKVAIPDRILLKPSRLTDEEFEVMKRHTLHGARTVEAALHRYPSAGFLLMARDIALTHHERFDGRGYPLALRGRAIPLAGRIAALADVYDAITSKRIYKQAQTHEVACEIIRRGAGTQFDPDIVKAFKALEHRFREISGDLSLARATVP
jgi:putative two-component system response regulator